VTELNRDILAMAVLVFIDCATQTPVWCR